MFELIFYIFTGAEPVAYHRIPAPVPAYTSKQACLEDLQELLKGSAQGVKLAGREDVITACEPVEA